jgi:hypothetical protein
MVKAELIGFVDPQAPRDEHGVSLYKKYNLPETPTLEQIEPIAMKLLANLETLFEGVELVMGRRVDAKELTTDNLRSSCLPLVIFMPSASNRFAALLGERTREQTAAKDQSGK